MRKMVFLAMIALLVASAVAAQPTPPRRPDAVRPEAALGKYLNLTADQIAAWQQIQKDTAATVQPLVANAADLRKQLDAALAVAAPDPLAVGKLAVALKAAREQVRTAHEAANAKRIALLTADQKARYDAFQAALAFMRHRGPGRSAQAGMRMGR